MILTEWYVIAQGHVILPIWGTGITGPNHHDAS